MALLTFVVKTGGDGLQIFDQQDTTWVDVEGYRGDRQLIIVFVGQTLEAASGGAFRAARHRVVASASNRCSLVYKMRAHADVWLPHRGMSVADLVAAFEAEHANAKPQASDGQPRASDVGGSSVSSPLLRRSIVNDAYPECFAVLRLDGQAREAVRLVAPSAVRCALVKNAHFRLWVLKQWSRQCKAGDLGGDVLQMIVDLSRPAAPTTFESLVQSAVQLANRTDLAIHNEEVQQGNREGAYKPWVAAQARFVRRPDGSVDPLMEHFGGKRGYRLLSLGHDDPLALAVDALGITHSIADVECFMLASPAALAEDNTEINLKLNAGGSEIFFRLRMNTQLVHMLYSFCNRQGIPPNTAVFLFDGHRVQKHDTPFVLDMEDGDVIDVALEQIAYY